MNPKDQSNNKSKVENEQDLSDRLHSLNERLEKKEKSKPVTRSTSSNSAGYANAMRLSSEFIAAILVGTAIGYTIDYFAGTLPWAMIFFLLLGFAAGVLNVMRAAGQMYDPHEKGE